MSDSSNLSSKQKRANGEGSVSQRKDGRWCARFTVRTPEGIKRKAVYAASENEAWAKLYEAQGHWTEYQQMLDEIDEESGQHVYFIQSFGGGPIKIGTATDVDRRFKTIQANSPVALKVLHVVQNAGRELETELHRRFALLRLHYEWFDNRPELLAYIDSLRKEQRTQRRAG